MSANIVRFSGDYKIQAGFGTNQQANIYLGTKNNGTVYVDGNLLVSGTTTAITTQNTTIKDNIITLNAGESGSAVSLTLAGIEIDRGTNSNGKAQFLFDESIQWAHPNGTTRYGIFKFETATGGINGIRTNSIDTNGGNLNLINYSTGVIKVTGTNNYEEQVVEYDNNHDIVMPINPIDDDIIPNIKTIIDYVSNISAVGNVGITQNGGTLNIGLNKTVTINNTLTFNGTDGSTITLGSGGTVVYTGNNLSIFTATTSAQLAGVISDETGSGALVFANTPTLVTPILGAATATTINGLTISSSTGTLTIADGKTLTTSNTLTFTGTDSSSVAFGTGGTVTYTSNKLSVFSSTSSSELAGVISDETGSGALVFANTPTLVTPVLGVATATTGATGTGNLVFSASPSLTGTVTIATLNLTNALGIAYGGTNSTSFTTPASNINPILYYNGTSLTNNSLAADIGYNSSTDNFFTRNITTVSLSSQSTSGGSLIQIQADPGAAMISGNRLGGIFFGGSTNNTHTIQNRASIETFTTQNWTVTNQGAKIVFSTTPNNTSSRVTALTIDQDQSVTFAGHLTVEGITSTGATGTGRFVFDVSPTLITPTLGAALATSINGLTISSSTGTLTVANSKTLTASNTLTFTGTDSSNVAFGTGGTVAYISNKLSVFSSTSSSELAGVISDETGTGSLVFANTPTLVTPVLGVATATTINKVAISSVSTGSTLTIADNKIFTVNNTLTFNGTDSSSIAFGSGGTVTYTANKLSVFSATSSSELAGVISDETGTGLLVFNNSPTLITPTLGAASATSINGLTISSSTGTLTIANGKTLTASNTLTFTGTDTSSVAFGTGGTVAYISNKLSVFSATSSSELAGVISDETGTGKLVFNDSPTITGHPTVEGVTSTGATGTGKFVFDGSPSLTTPTLGAASATSINGLTISSSTGTLTIANSKTLTTSNTLTFTGTDSSSVAFGAGGTVTYTSNKLSVFSATSSSELAGVISDETGTGSLVFATSPSLTTPTLGVASATSINKVVITVPATGSTLTIADGKTLTANNTLTFTGTDASNIEFSTGGTVTYTKNKLSVFSSTSSSELAGVISDETGTGKLVFNDSPTIAGHPTVEGVTSTGATGTGKFVFDGSPSLTTPTLGVATATSINGLTISSSTGTLTIANSKTLTANNTLTFTGTDSSSIEFSTGGTVTYTKNKLSVFSATSSSELAGVISDETGTGSLVFATSPSLTTPTLGVATATSINGLTISSSTGTLTIANGKTLTSNNTLTFTGTDASSVDFGAGGTVTYTRNKLNVFSSTSSSELAGVISDETGTGLLVFGTSPTIKTSLVTDSTSFDLVNTIATTVNFAGAATTISVGATTGNIAINSTDESTSITTGALTVAGGVGIGNKLYVNNGIYGETLTLTNQLQVMTDGTDGNSILLGNNGAHIYIDQYQLEIATAYGQNLTLGIGLGKYITMYDPSGNVNINTTTESTSTATGAFTVDGGVGIKKNLNVGGSTTMKFQASDPTANADGVTVYTKNADLGNTGIYYVNSTTSGELVSKKKALAYSIVFG